MSLLWLENPNAETVKAKQKASLENSILQIAATTTHANEGAEPISVSLAHRFKGLTRLKEFPRVDRSHVRNRSRM